MAKNDEALSRNERLAKQPKSPEKTEKTKSDAGDAWDNESTYAGSKSDKAHNKMDGK